jgi:hypothetical protein
MKYLSTDYYFLLAGGLTAAEKARGLAGLASSAVLAISKELVNRETRIAHRPPKLDEFRAFAFFSPSL